MLVTSDTRSYRRTKGGAAPWGCSDSLQTRCDRNRSFLPTTVSHAPCHLVTVTKILQNSWEAAQPVWKTGHICLSQRIWFYQLKEWGLHRWISTFIDDGEMTASNQALSGFQLCSGQRPRLILTASITLQFCRKLRQSIYPFLNTKELVSLSFPVVTNRYNPAGP